MKNGNILILERKAFNDVVHLPEIITVEPNLCFKVDNGNLRDKLT